MARTRGKREGPRDPTKQARIDAAVRDTLAGVFNSLWSAAIAYKVSKYPTNFNATQFSFQVPPQTVRDRASGKRVPRKSLVNEAQEKVLVDWCHHNLDSTTPLHPRTHRSRVLEMVGIYPGRNWVRHFLSQKGSRKRRRRKSWMKKLVSHAFTAT